MQSERKTHRGTNFEPAANRALAPLFSRVATRLPLPTATRFASAAGTVLWHISGAARKRADQNLRLIFGDRLSPEERRRTALGSFRNRCRRLAELAHLPDLTEDELRDLVVVEQAEHILEARREGHGVMIVSNHFCNPELTATRLALEDIDLAVVARLERYSAIPRVRQAYEAAPFKVLGSTDLSGAVAHLQHNGCVAVLPEVHGRPGAAKFNVLGLPIWIAKGVGMVAVRTGCAIVPGLGIRGPDGRVRAVVEPRLEIPDEDTTPREAQIHTVCGILADVLARNISQCPDNWLWLHHHWSDSPAINDEAGHDAPHSASRHQD